MEESPFRFESPLKKKTGETFDFRLWHLDNFFRRKNYFGSFFCDFGKKRRRNKKQIKLFDDDDDDDVATHAAAFGGIHF